MRYLLLSIALVVGAAYSQEKSPSQEHSKASAKKATKQKAGTEKAPFVVRIQPSEEDKKEAEERAEERKEKKHSDADLVLWTKVLAVLAGLQFAALLLQAGIFGYQSIKLKQTVQAANAQASDMKSSIAESARAATATEELAKATKANADRMESVLHRQMRAYISIDTGVPTCQSEGLRFAAAPVMQNTGFTPARNVCHKVKIAVLDLAELSKPDYKFDETAELTKQDNVLFPRQSFVINAVTPERVPDDQVEAIMRGDARRLFVWGTVTYDDIFGDSWETNFCHDFIFFREKDKEGKEEIKFLPYFFRRHNSAT